jgi:hypothetical protein
MYSYIMVSTHLNLMYLIHICYVFYCASLICQHVPLYPGNSNRVKNNFQMSSRRRSRKSRSAKRARLAAVLIPPPVPANRVTMTFVEYTAEPGWWYIQPISGSYDMATIILDSIQQRNNSIQVSESCACPLSEHHPVESIPFVQSSV